MPLNLELKIKVGSFKKITEKLNNAGAVYKGELVQRDIYYKAENRLLKLRIENDNQYLIQYIRNEQGGERWSDFELVRIEDNDAESFFNKIFRVEAVVNKRRLLYLYKNSRIHLDEVTGLGKFLEIETLVMNDKTDAKLRFNGLIKILNIDTSKEIGNSYRNLIKSTQR